MSDYPTLKQIQEAKEKLRSLIVETPAHPWHDPWLSDRIGHNTEVFVKLELLQVTGTFKPRGALNVMFNLDKSQLNRGVTTVSAGNHAIATAYASKVLGTTAKVVMPKNANPLRMQMARDLGAEIDLADNPHNAFARVQQIEREEGRAFIHPFEGPLTLQGTGTAGLEFSKQVPKLDAWFYLSAEEDFAEVSPPHSNKSGRRSKSTVSNQKEQIPCTGVLRKGKLLLWSISTQLPIVSLHQRPNPIPFLFAADLWMKLSS